ncbi:PLP-dependent aminotransferase family protein [Microbulbifer thermotolerans]|uniref:aminotransferase-like domain-containing protein n=1 Tax=Microbulbifer thermotolerans TaxID=252514 RepID=UPI00224AC342|nr:PLP-dependent aminotransferase family protein [Microbulbifer thermotolerans]MCX2840564.1 PLP-dependent aminotransferase family protein [Microbulbifer thermotolerans]
MAALYRLLAAQLQREIREHRWGAGQRLPSVRQFAHQHNVSVTTAIQCYRTLESEGLITARPQSGFYVRDTTRAEAGAELQDFTAAPGVVTNIAEIEQVQRAAATPGSAPFGISLLSPQLIPLTELQRSLHRATLKLGERLVHYAPPQGDKVLREALAQHFATDGLALPARDLLITNGCMDAICLALQLTTEPGDVVALPSPCFSGLLQLIESLDRRLLEIPLHRSGIRMQALEAAMANPEVKACVVTANHHNPLGFSLSVSDKQRIAAWAAEYRCPVIEDDVFGECGFDLNRSLPIKHWDRDGWVFWCSAFSKALVPAYRIGWCAPGRYLLSAVQRWRAQAVSVNLPLQVALADFVNTGHYRRHLQRLRLALAEQLTVYRRTLKNVMPAETAISRPDGGFVLWLTLAESFDGMALFEAAAARNISIVPGQVFSSLGRYRNCIRINCGWPLERRLKRNLQVLGEIASELSR